MVHRPRRLTDIICTGREAGLEPKVLKLVKGKEKEEPNIVLLKFVKDGGREMRILPELTVRNPDGSFTEEYYVFVKNENILGGL